MRDVKVLIVDDSALMRNLVGQIVESTEGLTVWDKAMNGMFALQKIERSKPDVIVLDIQMPMMDGLEFLKEMKKRSIKIPVIILSSLAKEGAKITMDCLEAGANEFITKPSDSPSSSLNTIAAQLSSMLLAYGRQQIKERETEEAIKKETPSSFVDVTGSFIDGSSKNAGSVPAKTDRPKTVPSSFFTTTKRETSVKPTQIREPGNIQIIAIGISTGGPNALRQVFAGIDPELPQPIVVVQHMPAGFTEEFARSLDKICPLEVKEAEEGDVIKTGRVLIAPGGKHLTVERRSLATIAHITEDAPQNGHRPSVSVLFDSIIKEYQNHALGIIMTGMGKDGAESIKNMFIEGSRTIGQDEASSVVYGMPRVAWELGGIMKQVSLDDMAKVINSYGKEFA